VLFGIATGVQAAIPDAQGVIHGCYSPNGAKATNGTTLNIIDSAYSCAKGQQAISWNQKGATGARGPNRCKRHEREPGATGPTGGRGPTGVAGTPNLPDSFFATDSHVIDFFATDSHVIDAHEQDDGTLEFRDLVTLSGLPAGTYLVWGNIDGYNAVDSEYSDFVAAGIQNVSPSEHYFAFDPTSATTFMETDRVTLRSNGSIVLKCGTFGDQAPNTLVGTITALKVNAAN
jgi:hypothetical protein